MVLLGDGLHNLTDGLAIGVKGGVEGGRYWLELGEGYQDVGITEGTWAPRPLGRTPSRLPTSSSAAPRCCLL